jgi:hypothetical protein
MRKLFGPRGAISNDTAKRCRRLHTLAQRPLHPPIVLQNSRLRRLANRDSVALGHHRGWRCHLLGIGAEDLKAEAMQRAEQNPLSGMMGVKHIDDEGRTVVNTADAGSGEPPEDWFVHMIAQAESFRRAMIVANSIDPVRLLIAQTIAIEERHFGPIVGQSPFVPQLQAPLYALGFVRFFQGDFASAGYLLIPQLEASLRYVLKAHGADPTKRRDDATEEDRSLDAIVGNHRTELIDILGEPLLDEVNRIFNIQPGPTLRHDVAHGQMSAGQCYSADVIYACWLLYRICCLFLLPKWEEWVRPGLAIEEPGR